MVPNTSPPIGVISKELFVIVLSGVLLSVCTTFNSCSGVEIIWLSTCEILKMSTLASSKVFSSLSDLMTRLLSLLLSTSTVNSLLVFSSISEE